jgi:protein tyrosine phosphatase (PTP) superfamily phosphohydrolase (DUF442 family)
MRGIYHFHKVSDDLACAGQPTEEQLKQLANENYRVIVNLGLLNTRYALPDEAGLIKELGIEYHHIPVNFEKPQLTELTDFITFMKQHAGEKTMVHCAANYRASVFTGLYLLAAGEMDKQEMEDFIDDIWQPNTVWKQFLEEGINFVEGPKSDV